MKEGRAELKFALPVSMLLELLESCAAHIAPDLNGDSLAPWLPELTPFQGAPPVGYRVSSLYLDDACLDGYAQRLDDMRIRNRLRIRTYGEPGSKAPVFLEAKRKLASRVIKHRVQVGDTEQWALGDPRQPWVDAVDRSKPRQRPLAERWVQATRSKGMGVVCRVAYLRETFVEGSSRLTLDHHVSAQAETDPRALRGPCSEPLLPAGWMVLELKYDEQKPAWMRHLVERLRLASEPVSKFALGVALTLRAHHPGEARRFCPPSIRRHLDHRSAG